MVWPHRFTVDRLIRSGEVDHLSRSRQSCRLRKRRSLRIKRSLRERCVLWRDNMAKELTCCSTDERQARQTGQSRYTQTTCHSQGLERRQQGHVAFLLEMHPACDCFRGRRKGRGGAKQKGAEKVVMVTDGFEDVGLPRSSPLLTSASVSMGLER